MRECTPTRDEARVLAKDHALIPVHREVLADMLTPVRAYSLLCPPGTPGFLLETDPLSLLIGLCSISRSRWKKRSPVPTI